MVRRLMGALAAASMLVGTWAVAGDAEIRQAVEQFYPTAKVKEINPSPFAGLFEVVVEDEVFYSDASGKFLVFGSLIDVEKKSNLTDDRKSKLTAVKFEDLPLQMATKIVKGNGSRVFATFEDAKCGYCKTMHRGLQKLNDYTQYVFMVSFLGPDSTRLADQLWCAKDKQKAVSDWMASSVPPADEKCKTPTNEVTELAKRLKVTGTPTIILADGSRIPGAVPPERLELALAKAQKAGKN